MTIDDGKIQINIGNKLNINEHLCECEKNRNKSSACLIFLLSSDVDSLKKNQK